MFNKQSFKKNEYQLSGRYQKKGYDWWWHSFTGYNHETGEEKAFFIEFFVINPGLNPNEVVLGQAKENKGKNRPSYLMVKCGSWGENKSQLHRFFALKDVKIIKRPIEITADDCYLSETNLKGRVEISEVLDGMMCDKGSMSFDLKIEKNIAYNVGYGTSTTLRKAKGFEMYWHAQGMKSFFEGEVIYNGIKYDVIKEKSFGYCDKNWGSDFTTPWLWLSSNNIYDKETGQKLENTVFDIGGGKPKVFGVTFKDKLLGAYYIEGKEYEYNFSKFNHPTKTKFSFKVVDGICNWFVQQSDIKTKMVTKIQCRVEDMLFVNYEAPNGLKLHNKLYNGGNGYGTLEFYEKKSGKFELKKTMIVKNVGCEYGEFDKVKNKN